MDASCADTAPAAMMWLLYILLGTAISLMLVIGVALFRDLWMRPKSTSSTLTFAHLDERIRGYRPAISAADAPARPPSGLSAVMSPEQVRRAVRRGAR